MERKLAAILMADIAEYTRLMEADEAQTHARHMALRAQVIDPAVAARGGQIVKGTGDGFLATFGSAAEAVACAVSVQRAVEQAEAAEPPERKIGFRMGLNCGTVLAEGGDVFGTAVNIAARLEDLSAPGGLLISAAVRDGVSAELLPHAIDLGFLPLKNVEQPVHAFRVVVNPGRDTVHAAASHPDSGRPWIAVLPFRTLDPDPAQAYFGDGIVEDIIASLSALRELPVISRNSTLIYRSDTVDLRKIGADLGVRYVVSGSVRRSPPHLRIAAELADTRDGSVLWAHRYDVDSGALFDVQDRITAEIVSTTMPRVRSAEVKRARQKRPESMDAYDCHMQALDILYQLDPESFARANALLQRAIALDDGYANAYALAAEWHVLRDAQGWSPDQEADRVEAVRLAEAAVARDGMNARALALLGHYRSFLFREYEAGFDLLARARDASPNNAWVWGLSAPTHNYLGDGEAAISCAERAIRLSPHDPWAFWLHTSLCVAHYTIGAYSEAVQWGQMSCRENPRFLASRLPTTAALAALGRIEEAQEAAKGVLSVDPRFSVQAYVGRHPYRDVERRTTLGQHLLAAGLPP